MGKIFKTPTDDSTEATLRAMHTQNTLDTYYEKSIGWIRTVIFSIFAVLITSLWELNSGESLWTSTVEWVFYKVQSLADWIWSGISG
jgi:hypothetical protein|tara:strand:- start:1936 stop:2196 length:261 start_codon:yes stop_codon:yes gene_type:complete